MASNPTAIAFLRKEVLIGMIVLWVVTSIAALVFAWDQMFPAIGAIALSIGLSIFLTHRFAGQEERRLWDNQEEVQQRMIWRYMQMVKRGRQGSDPLNEDQLAQRIDDSFESMLASKREEAKRETYIYEMIYSVVGTLQWGLGGMFANWLHG